MSAKGPKPDANVKVVRTKSQKSYYDGEGFTFRFLMAGDKMDLLEVTVKPESETDSFTHQGEEEHYILEGELEIILGDETYRLCKGDSIWHKSDIPHKWRNPTDRKTVVISAATPRTYVSYILEKM